MVVSMKKRMLKIVLGFSYVILVTMLLLIHVRATAEAVQRWVSCVEMDCLRRNTASGDTARRSIHSLHACDPTSGEPESGSKGV